MAKSVFACFCFCIFSLVAAEMTPLWDYDNGKCLISNPLVYEGRLFVSGRNAQRSNEGAIFELNPDSGKLLRVIPFPKDGQNGPYSGFSSPVVVDGMILHAWESIQAFDLATGERQWVVTDTGRIYGTPVVADGKIIFAGGSKLFALDYQGQHIWTAEIGAECAARLTTDGQKIYLGDQNGWCHAFKVADGQEVWKFRTDKPVRAKPQFYLGLVIFCSFDGSINALDRNNGGVRWRIFTRKMIFADPAISGNNLYVVDSAGMLRNYEASTGICQYETRLPDWGSSAITYHEGKLYLGDYAGHAMVIKASDGTMERQYQFRDWLRAAPAIYQGKVIFASMDGHLAAFDK